MAVPRELSVMISAVQTIKKHTHVHTDALTHTKASCCEGL